MLSQMQGGGRRTNMTLECPKSMVGRVIGRNGETIKALQNYTGSLVQIDQTGDPCRITISGNPHALSLAVSMVGDIIRGTFKGFALLRQSTLLSTQYPGQQPPPRPVYAPGYGLIPPSQLYGGEAAGAGAMLLPAGTPYAPQPRLQQAGYPFMPTGQVAPSQVVLQGLQPMPLSSVGLPGAAVYNIGGTAYSGPVYYSAQDYVAATGGLSEPQMPQMFYQDPMQGAGGAGAGGLLGGGGAGAKLLQAAGAKASMAAGGGGARNPLGVGKLSGSDNDHQLLSSAGGGVGAGAAGAPAAAAAAAANNLVSGSLVMDAEGQLYTYNLEG